MRVKALTALEYGVLRVPGEVFDLLSEDDFRGGHKREKRHWKTGDVLVNPKTKQPIVEMVGVPEMEVVPEDTPLGLPRTNDGMPSPPKKFGSRKEVFDHQQKVEEAQREKSTGGPNSPAANIVEDDKPKAPEGPKPPKAKK